MSRFILLMLFVAIIPLKAQTLHFKVIHDGKPLGTLDATKTVTGNTVIYTSHTEIEYHLLVAIKVVYDYHVTYTNDHLQEAKAHIIVRGNDKTKAKTVKGGSAYGYYSEGAFVKKIPAEFIKHSIVQLLFEEPVGVTKIYAEEHGEYHNIRAIDDHTYLKSALNGNTNTYYYKNGLLQKSDVNAGVIKFSIVNVPQ